METLTPTSRSRLKAKAKDPTAPTASTVKARTTNEGGGVGGEASTSAQTIKPVAGEKRIAGKKTALRAVTSESWDDDFLFQVSSSSSLALPLSPTGPSRSRPTTPSNLPSRPSSRQTSSTSPASPPSRHPAPAKTSPPSSALSNKPWLLQAPSSDSVESLASAWSDPDNDPTITHLTFAESNQTTPRADPTRRSSPSSPRHDDWRPNTPSLSEADSQRSATADETEAESFEQGEYSNPRTRRLSFEDENDRERFAHDDSRTAASAAKHKSWKNVLGFGGHHGGRRTGAREVIVPPGTAPGQFVVLGRRSRGDSEGRRMSNDLPRPTGILRNDSGRQPHSSAESAASHRSSLQFAPRLSGGTHSTSASLGAALLAGAPPSPHGPSTSLDPNQWREYDSTSAEETGTEGEMSGYSEDDDEGRRRRIPHVTPSTSFAGTASSAGATWNANASQASFASSASAFGLSPTRSEWDAPGADSGAHRRKLKKKRPPTEHEQEELGVDHRSLSPSLNLPLLSSRASATSSTGTGNTTPSASVYVNRRGADRRPDVAPFAQDSGDEVRRPRQRSATHGSAPSTHSPPVERGQVIEVDTDWLGAVPFPPEAHPPAGTKAPFASRLVRKQSAPGKSHPPVSGRNQGGAKRPLSLSSMLSRSTSSIPLGARRAPSPVPIASLTTSLKPPPTPTRPSSSTSLRAPLSTVSQPSQGQSSTIPSKKLHRNSSSVTDATKPKPESTSFLARARAFSRTGSTKPLHTTPSEPVRSRSPPPPSPTFARRPSAMRKPSAEHVDAASATIKGRLNMDWKMPRPESGVSDVSNASTTSTLRAMSNVSTAAPLPSDLQRKASAKASKPRPPPTRALQQGHRPSLSLSSVLDRPKSPFPHPPPSRGPSPSRPKTAMAVDQPGSYYFEETLAEPEVARRNSLSDLRIPSRITESQKRIEEDLERVQEFAKGIDQLKILRQQYQQLIRIIVSPPSSPEPDQEPFEGSGPEAVHKLAQAVKRLEIDYQSWWEQAEALVDLGDGKPRRADSHKVSPSVVASKRDRCVSLAQQSPSKRGTGSDTETDGPKRPDYARRPSASSFETDLSVEERQREMLRGVLAPATKGASLPSRGPPSPRPSLPILGLDPSAAFPSSKAPSRSSSTSSSKPFPIGLSTPTQRPRSGGIRRVSKAGVSGIKDFLLRLKLKASEESGIPLPAGDVPSAPRRSFSSPSRVATPTKFQGSMRRRSRSSSDEDEDWDRQSTPEVSPKGVSMRRTRTQSTQISGAGGAERMALSTEAMPSLLLKVKEVQERCSECIVRLRSLTV